VSHYVTADRDAENAGVLAAVQTVLNILSKWTQATKVRNRSCCGQQFLRELAVA